MENIERFTNLNVEVPAAIRREFKGLNPTSAYYLQNEMLVSYSQWMAGKEQRKAHKCRSVIRDDLDTS